MSGGTYRILGVDGYILLTEVLHHIQVTVPGRPVQGSVTLLECWRAHNINGQCKEMEQWLLSPVFTVALDT